MRCARPPRALCITSLVTMALAGHLGAQVSTHLDERTLFERSGPDVWSLGDGRCSFRATAAEAALITLGREADVVAAEVGIVVDTPVPDPPTSYVVAGVALHASEGNDWRLMLVAAPDGRRYPELIERLDGVHQAQTGAHSPPATLESTTGGTLAEWTPGRAYQLELTLGPDSIRGVVRDAETGVAWEKAYTLTGRVAVTRGRAALIAQGLSGAFESLVVTAKTPGDTQIAVQEGVTGAVLLVEQTPPSADSGPLAEALEGAGYGVTTVQWRDLEQAQIPFGLLDAVIVTDARAMSLHLRDELLAGLHSGGRLILIGAPAMSRVVALAGGRYVDERGWMEHIVSGAEREPLEIAAGAWSRGASDMAKPSSVAPLPGGGWAVTCELDNWDTYNALVTLPEEHDALILEARGGDATTHVVLELEEADGSRWFATIAVGEEWRAFALRPVDFGYWTDSRSVGRGGAGDAVRFPNVARFAFGLAKSHAPTLALGPHAYAIRGLSTARLGERGRESFAVPNIEIISPSYKLYPIADTSAATAAPGQFACAEVDGAPMAAAFSPVWRERGRGFDRGRSARWLPLVQTGDPNLDGRNSVVSMMIGDALSPGAVWAAFATQDPADALSGPLQDAAVDVVRAMSRGAFILEGGAEQFRYAPDETVMLGAEVVNAGRTPLEALARCTVTDADGHEAFARESFVTLAPRERTAVAWEWSPADIDPRGYAVVVELRHEGRPVDRVEHRIERLRTEPARPEELVRLVDRDFTLNGKPWRFLGINYWPTWVAGCNNIMLNTRDRYDPEIIERDLAWLESVGVNAISAVIAVRPTDPDAPLAYRDQRDFLDRCSRHGIKVHFTLPYGRPYADADADKLIAYIEAAGLRDHPAIVSWELAWEPIHGAWNNGLAVFREDFNTWIVQRYGSIEAAIDDWGFDPRADGEEALPVPTTQQCTMAGAWDVYVSAFRRAFSDLISREYGRIVRRLRAYDPNHLIAFRGGACDIPSGQAFAHIHSVGVAKHTDYLNPEGYSLQPWVWMEATPRDAIRRGGLVTLYHRFISREKPVVWMEFGYTVRGAGTQWTPQMLHTDPGKLAIQREEIESFYSMMVESGAKGAAPWWLPGGFRVGENSDFGFVEPDGRPRPVCEVMAHYNGVLGALEPKAPTRMIDLDLDLHDPTAWERYSAAYLDAVRAGETPGLRTAGTGTDSTDCPLTAVGGRLYNGHNPPTFLNAEFGALEARVGDGEWIELQDGVVLQASPGDVVECRALVGNLGEAAWVAPGTQEASGAVYLAGRAEYGLEFAAPIAADTPFLEDAAVPAFALLDAGATRDAAGSAVTVSFEMTARGRAFFGERRAITVAVGEL